jgi:AraC-like DNA-binding protein
MNRDIINIEDFTILLEESSSTKTTIDKCGFDEPIIGIAFYGTGNVDLKVKYGHKETIHNYTKGLVLSFYADEKVEFIHTIKPDNPLQCIVIATATRNLPHLPNQEGELFSQFLHQLVHPKDHYVHGAHFYMIPEMMNILENVFKTQYHGKTKMMFFRSQMTALLSHFFGQLADLKDDTIQESVQEKLLQAKEILSNNLESPPSLSELSRQIGMNTFKLKKNFKDLFGVPVFKYLQNKRMSKAHQLLNQKELSVQEVAWEVGYSSLSSFSNAFTKKFGYRPSEIKQ